MTLFPWRHMIDAEIEGVSTAVFFIFRRVPAQWNEDGTLCVILSNFSAFAKHEVLEEAPLFLTWPLIQSSKAQVPSLVVFLVLR